MASGHYSLWGLLLLQITGSRHSSFSTCGTWAQKLWPAGSRLRTQQLWHVGVVAPHMWNLPRPEIKPMSPALADRFLSTTPPGKSKTTVLITIMEVWMKQTMTSGSSPKVGIMDYFKEEQNQQRGSSLLLNATAEKTRIHIGSLSTFLGIFLI